MGSVSSSCFTAFPLNCGLLLWASYSCCNIGLGHGAIIRDGALISKLKCVMSMYIVYADSSLFIHEAALAAPQQHRLRRPKSFQWVVFC